MYCTVCDKLEVPSYHGNYRLCDICGEHFLCLTLAIQHKEQCRGQNNEIMMVREEAVVTVDGIVKNANDGDTVSFLSSLSKQNSLSGCHPEALPFMRNFQMKKVTLTNKLYRMYNESIFENKLPEAMKIIWNSRLRTTAGICRLKSYKKGENTVVNYCEIDLSKKLITTPERLRDTLVHELCHAACWIITGVDGAHGPLWRGWVARAMNVFTELPNITRCHKYM